jgi:hypothetical protein
MRDLKTFFDPSYVLVRFCAAARGRAHAIEIFFFRFCMLYIKMKLLQGDRTPTKTFSKNQLTLLYIP